MLTHPHHRLSKRFAPQNNLTENYRRTCQTWKSIQPNPIRFMEALPPCWPSVPLTDTDADYETETGTGTGTGTFPETFGTFQMDSACNPKNPGLCEFLYPGASSCYRSSPLSDLSNLYDLSNLSDLSDLSGLSYLSYLSNVTIVQQCCYGSDYRLLVGPPGGGRLEINSGGQGKL